MHWPGNKTWYFLGVPRNWSDLDGVWCQRECGLWICFISTYKCTNSGYVIEPGVRPHSAHCSGTYRMLWMCTASRCSVGNRWAHPQEVMWSVSVLCDISIDLIWLQRRRVCGVPSNHHGDCCGNACSERSQVSTAFMCQYQVVIKKQIPPQVWGSQLLPWLQRAVRLLSTIRSEGIIL